MLGVGDGQSSTGHSAERGTLQLSQEETSHIKISRRGELSFVSQLLRTSTRRKSERDEIQLSQTQYTIRRFEFLYQLHFPHHRNKNSVRTRTINKSGVLSAETPMQMPIRSSHPRVMTRRKPNCHRLRKGEQSRKSHPDRHAAPSRGVEGVSNIERQVIAHDNYPLSDRSVTQTSHIQVVGRQI